MSLTLPESSISFYTGTIESFEALVEKNKNTLYFVKDDIEGKFYLYLGENLIYSKVDKVDSVEDGNNNPVTSSAVYNYTQSAFEFLLGDDIADEDLQIGKIYYLSTGELKFKPALGSDVKKIIINDISSAQSIEQDLTINGNTLYLTNTIESSATGASNPPPLVIGSAAHAGTNATARLEISKSEIQAKNNGTYNSTLKINPAGGAVTFGSGMVTASGNMSVEGTLTANDINSDRLDSMDILINNNKFSYNYITYTEN